MTQLTSIKNLRNSHAMQSRVENVMRFLQSHNKDWQAEWAFPIALINLSNDQADCTWVRNATGTHIKPTEVVGVGGKIMTAEHIINNLKGLSVRTVEDLAKMNDAIVSAVGNSLSWTHGLVIQPQGAAVAQAPFVPPALKVAPEIKSKPAMSPSGSVISARKSASPKKSAASTVKPISVRKTKLDEAKALFSDLTPKQKVELSVFVQEKVGASKACQEIANKGVSAAQVGA